MQRTRRDEPRPRRNDRDDANLGRAAGATRLPDYGFKANACASARMTSTPSIRHSFRLRKYVPVATQPWPACRTSAANASQSPAYPSFPARFHFEARRSA